MPKVNLKIQSILDKLTRLKRKMEELERENEQLRKLSEAYKHTNGHKGQSSDALKIKIEEIQGEVNEVLNLIDRVW